MLFQFTHPGKGATSCPRRLFSSLSSFNSRTLGRVRQERENALTFCNWFQFTHPGKGATYAHGDNQRTRAKFQFTHPGKGATKFLCHRLIIMWCFNSRTLGRVRLALCAISQDGVCRFNSRTLGRVRPPSPCNSLPPTRFQFTHPGKGATGGQVHRRCALPVSIHAPWEGCDSVVQSCVL